MQKTDYICTSKEAERPASDIYDRKRLKKAGINSDDLPFYFSVRG